MNFKLCRQCNKLFGVDLRACDNCRTVWNEGDFGTLKNYEMTNPRSKVSVEKFYKCSFCENLTDKTSVTKPWMYICYTDDCINKGLRAHGSLDQPASCKFYFE